MSSEIRSRRFRRWAPFLPAAALFAAFLLSGASPLLAKVFLTQKEALELAFPGCETVDQTAYLSDEQLERARELAGEEIESALVRFYEARRDGELVGLAYFDAHRVRTLPETLMVAVEPSGKVLRIEILSFNEPEDYIPREVWYEQFLEQPLDDDLQLGRDIRAVTGATLTARATTQAVRRALAIHEVLQEKASP